MNRKIILDAEVFTRIIKEINPAAAAIYATIIGHRNGKTGECYVTQYTLAEECNTTERTIIRNLNKLKDQGFLDWKKGSSFSSKANSYIFPQESFDMEGKGINIEAKKLKDKNKEEKIKNNVKKIKEEAVITLERPKLGPPPTIAQLKQFTMKRKAAIVKNESKEKAKESSNYINTLIKECNRLVKEYNDLAKNNMDLFENGFSSLVFSSEDDIKKLIKMDDIDRAVSIASYQRDNFSSFLEGLKEKINKKKEKVEFEKKIENITLEEAMKVYSLVKEEVSDFLVKKIEHTWEKEEKHAKEIVKCIKLSLEAKGKVFNLEEMLIA